MSNIKLKKKLESEKKERRDKIHSFHRYFGKLIPAIPRFAIKKYTNKNDNVLDCYCGSGTTLVEARLLDRNSYGCDLNPLSVLITKVKSNPIEENKLQKSKEELFNNIKNDNKKNLEEDTPYCVNINHWFKPFVKKDLIILNRNINKIKNKKTKDFFKATFSAFLRDVSNADPRHIFPGYSKRMRELDSKGVRKINVMNSFERAINKRMKWEGELYNKVNGHTAKPYIYDARKMSKKINDIDLIVTNPPYISSIRYLETVKLEMSWLKFILNPKHYTKIDKTIIGTERLFSEEIKNYEKTGLIKIDWITKKLFDINQKKMSKVVYNYFSDMKESFNQMYEVLNKNGHIVMKISDSFVRGINVPTPNILIKIAKNRGFKVEANFKDEILNRSLMTKRNYYSGIIQNDWILIFKK